MPEPRIEENWEQVFLELSCSKLGFYWDWHSIRIGHSKTKICPSMPRQMARDWKRAPRRSWVEHCLFRSAQKAHVSVDPQSLSMHRVCSFDAGRSYGTVSFGCSSTYAREVSILHRSGDKRIREHRAEKNLFLPRALKSRIPK